MSDEYIYNIATSIIAGLMWATFKTRPKLRLRCYLFHAQEKEAALDTNGNPITVYYCSCKKMWAYG